MRPLYWAYAFALTICGANPSHAEIGTLAHDDLAHMLDRIPGDAAFLPSFRIDAQDGSDFARVNRETAYTYDNALAILALLAAGDAPRAQRIGKALLRAMDHDRFWHDGRLRNAYRAGMVDSDVVKLPGWWDSSRGLWAEDRYQIGTASGSMAFAGIALYQLGGVYRGAAYRIARWIVSETQSQAGCFAGGFLGEDREVERVTWCSTEHNIDVAALLRLIGDSHGEAARAFVASMRDPESGRVFTGTKPDGVTINKDHSALDAMALGVASGLFKGAQARAILAAAERLHGVAGLYSFSSARDAVWIEGSAEMAIAYRQASEPDRSASILSSLLDDRAPGGYWRAIRGSRMSTGLSTGVDPGVADFVYYPVPHLAPTAWILLAAKGSDPL